MTTTPQRQFIEGLLRENGMTIFKMRREHEEIPHADLGFDTVDEWLNSLSTRQASEVIDYLKELR